MPDTKVPGELSLAKILHLVSNLYHQATVIMLILKTPLISDAIMAVGVTVARVIAVTPTITIRAEILNAHCVHTIYYHKRLTKSLSVFTQPWYIYV